MSESIAEKAARNYYHEYPTSNEVQKAVLLHEIQQAIDDSVIEAEAGKAVSDEAGGRP